MSENMSFLKNKFNLEVPGINKIIVICFAPKCVKSLVKPVSEAVTTALKLIYNQIEHYNISEQSNCYRRSK